MCTEKDNSHIKNALRALILGVPRSIFYITHKHNTPVYIQFLVIAILAHIKYYLWIIIVLSDGLRSGNETKSCHD